MQIKTHILIRLSVSLTCRLLAPFPLPVAIETSDAAAIINTAVVNSAIQREWNCTALSRDS